MPRSIQRIEQVLTYIEAHLDSPLSLNTLTACSGWSRWQLQRVFQHATGVSVAHYVRQRRLSRAAELLLTSRKRHLDIALQCGFTSEVSFNRAFRQQFHQTPGAYRRRQAFTGLTLPITRLDSPDLFTAPAHFVPIRIETQPAFHVMGIQGEIKGLLSAQPDFIQTVPQIWHALTQQLAGADVSVLPAVGVIDTQLLQQTEEGRVTYWAALECTQLSRCSEASLSGWQIPQQTYAVIPHHGPVRELQHTLNWVLCQWLPDSGREGCYGFELERYGCAYQPESSQAYMEYWLPIQP